MSKGSEYFRLIAAQERAANGEEPEEPSKDIGNCDDLVKAILDTENDPDTAPEVKSWVQKLIARFFDGKL